MKISSIVLVFIHIVIVQVFLRKLYCYSIMVVSLSFLGETISQKTFWSSGSYYLSTSILKLSLKLLYQNQTPNHPLISVL